MRLRRAVAEDEYAYFLRGIVEADETYLGGKPRKGNHPRSVGKSKRGRGTDKMPGLGAVERGGRVMAEPSIRVDRASVESFITSHVYASGSTLVTDQYVSYRYMLRFMEHITVDHRYQYVHGIAHTNTIEGFWSLLKRAWFGTHHHYSRQWAVAYVTEACFKYNVW